VNLGWGGGLAGRAARGRRPLVGRAGTGEGRERREREQREKDGIDSKFEFFSKISVET